MRTVTSIEHNLTPKQLAVALSEAEPREFAQFWLEFANKTDDKKLHAFAEVMAPDQGANRKIVFEKLHQLIKYYEVKFKNE